MDITDYEKIGLKVGLEIHKQLDTKQKLFCNCPIRLSDKKTISFLRKLRPTQSELGQIDPAALFEFQKGKKIIYEAYSETSCLVEMDEEPPHEINPEAIDIALKIALILNSKPVDEVHVMRKIVIDGSNTTGFQRTCVIALGGFLKINNKKIPIEHISLEEDAARKISESELSITYRIDRLGIPLIEIATSPVINSPKEAEDVAYEIGKILKSTKAVKRGLGTIRQDLNISIKDGALIEVKGVQQLELISKVIEYEVQRQLKLLEIKKELISREVKLEHLKEDFLEVSNVFKNTSCKIIKRALSKNGVVLATVLKGFKGILSVELEPGIRFGTELAQRAIFWGKVEGIFHTDELPRYGISEEEVKLLKQVCKAEEQDAIVIVADELNKAKDALRAVVERAKEALIGVPGETRVANPNGTTHYMRPRPGASRMYPETDIPPLIIDEERIAHIKANLPPGLDTQILNIMKTYSINKKLAEQLIDSEFLSIFQEIAENTKIAPSFIATVLVETMKSLQREGLNIEALTNEQIKEAFQLIDKGITAKESIVDILTWLIKNPDSTPLDAIEKLNLKMLSKEELVKKIEKCVNENIELIKLEKEKALNKLMKLIMKDVRGKADAKLVSKILKEKIEFLLKPSSL
ncbi:MAG: Glu-tRNA(Gln) amidotransferase subunit GatE [Candidatus Bathyarchaeia archaeon]